MGKSGDNAMKDTGTLTEGNTNADQQIELPGAVPFTV